MLVLFVSCKIDVFIVVEFFNVMGEFKVGGWVLCFIGDIWKNYFCCVICMYE